MVRRVALIVPPDFQILDLAGPMSAFEAVWSVKGAPEYRISVLSTQGGPQSSSAGAVIVTAPLDDTAEFGTVLICGGMGAVEAQPDPALSKFLGRHAADGRRVGSICTGAFILAQSGWLDDRRATTHWRYAERLATRFPRVRVEPDRIWVRDGPVWTSAGVSAGIDLSLAMIAEDQGIATARRIARELVVYYRRPGGQTQYSALLDADRAEGRFADLLVWVRDNLGRRLSVEELAARVAMSPRNFSRAFRAETGMTPARAIERLRIETARSRVAGGTDHLTRIALETGFGCADRMRNAFIRHLGTTPQAMRRTP